MKVTKARFGSLGGVHPRYGKARTQAAAVETLPAPKTVRVSLAQHLGAPSKPLVKKGDAVSQGQPIAEPSGFVSACVHAPVSGTIKSIEDAATVSGRAAVVVEIESNGQPACPPSPVSDWKGQPAKALIERIQKAGIIGMGGAGFPTHIKLSPPVDKKIDTLIINGAECEPYLTADDRLMVEQAARVWSGAQILRHVLGAQALRIAIEDNKPDAVAAMEEATQGADGDVEIVVLPTEYPQGAEKQLIYSVTGRQVPSGGLPMDVGALVENVGTAAAVHDALIAGIPLTHRVITVTGTPLRSPKNILAPVGTILQDLADFCGGFVEPPGKIICGGPMMGIAQSSLDVGMGKTSSGLLFLARSEVAQFTSMPCIACGRCVQACPMRLLPCTLSECIEAENFVAAEEFCVLDCIECGSCAFECPARRPLVQHMKLGKARAMLRRQKQQAEKK